MYHFLLYYLLTKTLMTVINNYYLLIGAFFLAAVHTEFYHVVIYVVTNKGYPRISHVQTRPKSHRQLH